VGTDPKIFIGKPEHFRQPLFAGHRAGVPDFVAVDRLLQLLECAWIVVGMDLGTGTMQESSRPCNRVNRE